MTTDRIAIGLLLIVAASGLSSYLRGFVDAWRADRRRK